MSDHESSGPSRRGFLKSAALAGAGASLIGKPAFAASNNASWRPDANNIQFTLAVMPDTQFLYWGSQNSINRTPQEESFRYIIENNFVFMAHLGDLTEDADATSFAEVDKAFDILDAHGVAYSVVAGNHDVSGDDSRGSTPYLRTMGPQRFKRSPSFIGSDPTGYNTAHMFKAAGMQWLVLALDWRMTAQGFAWANQVIKDHPHTPVILTTHEIVGSVYDDNVYPYESGDPSNNAAFSAYGQQVWDDLINANDQIFLTLNGHYWPPGRMTKQNAAGHDVHLHIANYQNRYFGGGGMLRLYHFDLARNTIDVETLAPWILAQPPASRNTLAAREARLTTSVDNFSMPIDFSSRFAGFLPVPGRPARPASEVLVPGTLAYWRFDAGGHHPDQPAHASLRFVGGKNPLHGAYLTTAASAFLNKETFTRGYTIEAFVKFPLDWDAGNNGWMSVLARRGAAGQAGKHSKNTDPQEPVGALSISNNGREPQFNVYPLNQASPTTNWGHGLVELQWWHIAVVNDGTHTRMYVESSPVVDNPSTPSNGIATLNLPWLVGGHEYAGAVDQVFHGWIGDVRVVNRPLSPRDFLTAK